MRFKSFLAPALAAISAIALSGCVIEDNNDPDATLLVINESDYDIHELYLVENYSQDWGRNLLAGDVLFPDESLLLSVDCGFYDALIVDDEGVECQLLDLDLCLNDADWVIRNNTCNVFGAKQKPNEPVLTPPTEASTEI